MADVHDRIDRQRKIFKDGRTKNHDPIPPVAEALAEEAWILCFDEFSVTDIADAMILSRLFSALFEAGVVLVATSNVAPEDLYRDGLNRGLFLPFIDILKTHAAVLELHSARDYRLEKLNRLPVYVVGEGEEADRRMDEAWATLAEGHEVRAEEIALKGRKIAVPKSAGRAARFTFRELCGEPLGARDFMAIAERYDTLVIDHVPVMSRARRNEAKRFILLVDVLYDQHKRVFISAAAAPDALYADKSGTEAFEFQRTASRLIEMQTHEWAETAGTAQKPPHEPRAERRAVGEN
jgi:cell division protein ZapE